MGFAGGLNIPWRCLERYKTAGCVGGDAEMASVRRADVRRPRFGIDLVSSEITLKLNDSARSYLVVDQTPLLKERMHTHD